MNQAQNTSQITSVNQNGLLDFDAKQKSIYERSRVYLGDCMDFLKQVPDKYFCLSVVDPPYGIDIAKRKHYGRRSHSKSIHSKTGSGYTVKRNDYNPKNWDNSTPSYFYFEEIKRISKNQIIWGYNYFNLNWGNGLIKWNKLHANGLSFKTYEYAYCSLINEEIEFKYLWSGMMQAKSINEPTTQQGNKVLNETRIHPTQKPVALYSWIYKNYLPEGGKVIDTHLGSGSNRIAADKSGNIDFYGWEIDKDYFLASDKRFQDYKKQLRMF